MSGPVDRWRLAAAAFLDDPASATWSEALGASLGPATDLLVKVLGRDLASPPRDVDGEAVGEVLGVLLPGRLEGSEPFVGALPDLLEAFLEFVARFEGLSTAWEWTHAVSTHRARFEDALRDPARVRPATPAGYTPDRRAGRKLGRNDPCFCGSGRKYKHCCARMFD